MPLDFPNSPTIGQTFSSGTRKWTWTGEQWSAANIISFSASDFPDSIRNSNLASIQSLSATPSLLTEAVQPRLVKAWVNFNGTLGTQIGNFEINGVLTPTNGGNNVNWYSAGGGWVTGNNIHIGTIIRLVTIGGSSSGTLGGVPCSQLFLQLQSITNVNNATFKLVNPEGTPTPITFTSNATVTGNGTSSGVTYQWTAVRSSYNVSSITRIAAGQYQINFITPMSDTFYSTSGMSEFDNTYGGCQLQEDTRLGSRTTSSFVISLFNSTGNAFADSKNVSVQVFGN
jgi:hypothetical protein